MADPITPPQQQQSSSGQVRFRLEVRGCVQGVGFRPFTLKQARKFGLAGWVTNSPQGVTIEAEGSSSALTAFRQELVSGRPPLAQILGVETSVLEPVGESGFLIRPSQSGGRRTTLILPDIRTCDLCLEEMWNPRDRRYRYPFINCTQCGPRFSIITSLPYDRPNTTMAGFPLCEDCRREYEDPLNRRYHAQPVACPRCGPHLALWDGGGRLHSERDAALLAAAEHLRNGLILAVKGLGGFHLMAAAGNEEAVQRLRSRKHREAKPLAVMFPDLDTARQVCSVSSAEQEELCSPAAPIVLLDRRSDSGSHDVADTVAPGYRSLGVMLPYTPLHHLVLNALRAPVVATSGNAAEEPICIDETEAQSRLAGIADFFLVHNRPIARHVDDSVVRVVLGQPMLLRRGRGFTPCVVGDISPEAPAILAVGADLKNCAAQSYGPYLLTGQHVGDLGHPRAFDAFTGVAADLHQLWGRPPSQIVCDLHPDYHSTRWSLKQSLPVRQIQHHHAHVVSCMVEHGLEGNVLGVSWDGTGYGPDGTIWGGEFPKVDRAGFQRFAHLRTFSLPGGDKASRDGRLCGLGLLYEMYGAGAWKAMPQEWSETFTSEEKRVLLAILERRVNTHRTSSAGRLFDGVAALLGIRSGSRFEGEAAAALETCAWESTVEQTYEPEVEPDGHGAWAVNWGPMLVGLLQEQARGAVAGDLARCFHTSLAEAMAAVARVAEEERVVLTGGCFQNRLLLESATSALERAGFKVYRHRRVPPNDGGISVGQLAAAWAAQEKESS